MIKTHLRYTSNLIVYRIEHVPELGCQHDYVVRQAWKHWGLRLSEGMYRHHRLLKNSVLYQGTTLVGP
jgi:hypothetical protein